jgi:hypothetical protein
MEQTAGAGKQIFSADFPIMSIGLNRFSEQGDMRLSNRKGEQEWQGKDLERSGDLT